MSFLNTIRGLGRSSKKNKKDLDPTLSTASSSSSPAFYAHSNLSGNNLRRTQSPTKTSPSKHSNSPVRSSAADSSSIRSQQGYALQQLQQVSPTKRNRLQHPQQQQQQQQLLQHHNQNRQLLPLRTIQRKSKSQHFDASSSSASSTPPPLFLCEPYVRTALVKGSYKTIVQLPAYVDLNEWLTLNIFEFFGNLDSFYGLVSDFVTPDQFPTMNAGPTTNYLWVDSTGQAVNLPARTYIDYVITWISSKINDQENFPTKTGAVFPPFVQKDVKNITRQMFRIFAFIYYNQFDKIVHLSLEAHFNSFFAHFVSFIKEFGLLDQRELEPLQCLIDSFEQQGKIN